MTTAADLAAHLNGRRSGDGWMVRCPAHDDRKASLFIAQGAKTVLFHCFTGCSAQQILAALKVEPRELRHAQPLPMPQPPRPAFNAALWWTTARTATTFEKLQTAAAGLGVAASALDWLGACTLGDGLQFPMRDGSGHIIGVRTRGKDGEKKAILGSRAGLILTTCPNDDEPLVTEGPTDAAAALQLGFEPIGRPSCSGSEQFVVDLCKTRTYQRLTICADSDGPGFIGAERLAAVLLAGSVAVRLVHVAPEKDLREWVRQRVTRMEVDAKWSQTKWRMPYKA